MQLKACMCVLDGGGGGCQFVLAFLCLTFSAVTHLGVGRVRLNNRIRKGRLIAEQKVAVPRPLR